MPQTGCQCLTFQRPCPLKVTLSSAFTKGSSTLVLGLPLPCPLVVGVVIAVVQSCTLSKLSTKMAPSANPSLSACSSSLRPSAHAVSHLSQHGLWSVYLQATLYHVLSLTRKVRLQRHGLLGELSQPVNSCTTSRGKEDPDQHQPVGRSSAVKADGPIERGDHSARQPRPHLAGGGCPLCCTQQKLAQESGPRPLTSCSSRSYCLVRS